MKNLHTTLVVLTFILLVFTSQSQSQIYPGFEIHKHNISFWNAVYPLGSFGWGGCGWTIPKTLVIEDIDQPDFFVTFEGGKR